MRRWSAEDIGTGDDQAVLGWPIPADCVMNSVHAEIHVAAIATKPVADAHIIALQGWILQSETGADYNSIDTLWDKFVPKDDSPDALDVDVVADSDSVFEPGLVNMNQIMEQEIGGPERVYKDSQIMTIANMRQAAFKDTDNTYIPSHVFKLHMNNKWRVQDDSGLIFALAAPDMVALSVSNNDVIISTSGSPRDAFFTLAHLEDFVHLAMINLTNMTESGAEEPYENLFAFIEQTLEQVQGVAAISNWSSAAFNSWSKGIAGLKTMNETQAQTLGPDAQAQ